MKARVNREGIRYVYDGNKIVQERNELSDELIAEYTYVNNNVFKQKRGTEERWVYTYPEGGWPRHLFDHNGDRTDSLEFTWNGELVFHQGDTELGFGWSRGWMIAFNTDMPMIFLTGSNEVWLPKLATSLNKACLYSFAVSFSEATGTDSTIGTWVDDPVRPWNADPNTADVSEGCRPVSKSCCGNSINIQGSEPVNMWGSHVHSEGNTLGTSLTMIGDIGSDPVRVGGRMGWTDNGLPMNMQLGSETLYWGWKDGGPHTESIKIPVPWNPYIPPIPHKGKCIHGKQRRKKIQSPIIINQPSYHAPSNPVFPYINSPCLWGSCTLEAEACFLEAQPNEAAYDRMMQIVAAGLAAAGFIGLAFACQNLHTQEQVRICIMIAAALGIIIYELPGWGDIVEAAFDSDAMMLATCTKWAQCMDGKHNKDVTEWFDCCMNAARAWRNTDERYRPPMPDFDTYCR